MKTKLRMKIVETVNEISAMLSSNSHTPVEYAKLHAVRDMLYVAVNVLDGEDESCVKA